MIEDVWGHGVSVTERVVDNQILGLRKKIEPDPARPRFLVSVRGMGYRSTHRNDTFVTERRRCSDFGRLFWSCFGKEGAEMTWKLSLKVLFAAALAFAVPSTRAQSSVEKQLQAARQKEQVEGDLKAAIRLYEQVATAKRPAAPRSRRRGSRIGRCYENSAAPRHARLTNGSPNSMRIRPTPPRKRTALNALDGPAKPKTGELIVRKLSDGADNRPPGLRLHPISRGMGDTPRPTTGFTIYC